MAKPKLIRDKIPELFESNSNKKYREMDVVEFEERLLEKLEEEVAEYLEDRNTEELADILEVVYALAELHDTSKEELEEIRKEKEEKRGAFKKKIILDKL
jgi:predicted house-cleaning noncanonical NTP pyrophosphatase (MazG superfamily)